MPKQAADPAEPPSAPVQTPAEEKPPEDWQPQQADPETGVFMTGDYPSNHRLRAEALVKARRKSDPDSIVSDELIADAAARMRAEREAE